MVSACCAACCCSQGLGAWASFAHQITNLPTPEVDSFVKAAIFATLTNVSTPSALPTALLLLASVFACMRTCKHALNSLATCVWLSVWNACADLPQVLLCVSCRSTLMPSASWTTSPVLTPSSSPSRPSWHRRACRAGPQQPPCPGSTCRRASLAASVVLLALEKMRALWSSITPSWSSTTPKRSRLFKCQQYYSKAPSAFQAPLPYRATWSCVAPTQQACPVRAGRM